MRRMLIMYVKTKNNPKSSQYSALKWVPSHSSYQTHDVMALTIDFSSVGYHIAATPEISPYLLNNSNDRISRKQLLCI